MSTIYTADLNLTIMDEACFSEAEMLLEKLRKTLLEITIDSDGPSILNAVRTHFSAHLVLKGTPFEIAINNYLENEIGLLCNVYIDTEVLEGLWINIKIDNL